MAGRKRVLERYEAWLTPRRKRGVSEHRRLLRADEIFEACLRALDHRGLAVLGDRYGKGSEDEYARVAHDLRVMLGVPGEEEVPVIEHH